MALLLVVGDYDKRDAQLLLDVDQLKLRVLAQLAIQRGEGLIQQEQLRPLDQGACERHTLALSAGELMRLTAEKGSHLDDFENLADPAPDLVPPEPLLLETERDVLLDIHVREQRIWTGTSC